ncbi:MAG: phytoene desaturase family protein [Thermoanaerobaculia bacterium]
MSGRVDAVILGAGLEGLVCAATLARAGLEVLVLEERERPGGAVATEEIAPGFSCDVAQHDVAWVPPRLVTGLGLAGEGLELVQPDPAVLVLPADGEPLPIWRDPGATQAELRRHSSADATRWPGFVERLRCHATLLGKLYAQPAPLPLSRDRGDLLQLGGLGLAARRLGGGRLVELLRTLPMPAADWLDDELEHEPLKAVLAGRAVAGVFQGPRSGGTAFVLLHNAVGTAVGDGLCPVGPRTAVPGGVGRLAQALAGAATRFGAHLRYGARIERILTKDEGARGVALAGGEEIAARCVVSSLDPRRTFLDLVDPLHLAPDFVRAVGNIRYRGGWAKINLALAELPHFPGLDAARPPGFVVLARTVEQLERAYDDAKHGHPSREPYLEVSMPSLHDARLAPPGQHVMSVLVRYVPYRLADGPWDAARREAMADGVIEILGRSAPNLPGAVLHRQVLAPPDLETRFGLPEGSEQHGELGLDQILFMRPVAGCSRYRTPVADLYLCGPATHPGGGVTGASGRLAARTVVSDRKDRRHPR